MVEGGKERVLELEEATAIIVAGAVERVLFPRVGSSGGDDDDDFQYTYR